VSPPVRAKSAFVNYIAEWEFDWLDAATLVYQMGRRFEMV
jgi:hypothetical protein